MPRDAQTECEEILAQALREPGVAEMMRIFETAERVEADAAGVAAQGEFVTATTGTAAFHRR